MASIEAQVTKLENRKRRLEEILSQYGEELAKVNSELAGLKELADINCDSVPSVTRPVEFKRRVNELVAERLAELDHDVGTYEDWGYSTPVARAWVKEDEAIARFGAVKEAEREGYALPSQANKAIQWSRAVTKAHAERKLAKYEKILLEMERGEWQGAWPHGQPKQVERIRETVALLKEAIANPLAQNEPGGNELYREIAKR